VTGVDKLVIEEIEKLESTCTLCNFPPTYYCMLVC